MTTTDHERRPELPTTWVLLAAAVGATLGYGLAVEPEIRTAGQVLYPIVWVAISLGALWYARPSIRSFGPLPAAVAVAYPLVLLWTAGLLTLAVGPPETEIYWAMPGWGPAVLYTGFGVSVRFVPFLFAGYATLGVLAGAALSRTLEATAAGVLGLFACVSCTAPLLAGLAGSLGAGTLAATIQQAQYPVATVAFALSAFALTAVVRSAP